MEMVLANSSLVAGVAITWLVIVAVVLWVWKVVSQRRQVQSRWVRYSDQEAEEQIAAEATRSRLGWWLYRAGFRSSSAATWFVVSTLGCLLLGGVFIAAIYWSGVEALFVSLLLQIPGGVGEVFLPLAWVSPWLGGMLLGGIPALVVFSTRKRRVQLVEQDLPITLDLLATLSEAGLAFDSALGRILETQPTRRPLAEDLRLFQIDLLAGRPRVEALRGLMQRVDVSWFSIFISAVIHAEQVGSGLTQTLRTQADDLRMRRRERALALAMSIPVKLLFPLVVCFLPGIMTAALGPVSYQIVQVLDSFLRGSLGP